MTFISNTMMNWGIQRLNIDLLGKLLYPDKEHFKIEVTTSCAIGILLSDLCKDQFIHVICIDIFNHLVHIVPSTIHLNWYKKQVFKAFIEQHTVPYMTELFVIVLTPLGLLIALFFLKISIKRWKQHLNVFKYLSPM